MSEPYINIFGNYLYYTEDKYTQDKQAIDYLWGLEASEVKTFFDAAFATGQANFTTAYGYDYKIIYDYSSKRYTLEPR